MFIASLLSIDGGLGIQPVLKSIMAAILPILKKIPQHGGPVLRSPVMMMNTKPFKFNFPRGIIVNY
jgi:hypothetical protein